MSGFKSETETGVKSSFSGLAKIAGLAFGGAAVGALIKSSIESAGQTQQQAIAIKNVYGTAGNAIIRFAKTSGVALGGLEASTEGFAVKSGQLFKNLGFNTGQAQKYALGLTKIGLAVNQLRGGGSAGAAQILGQLSSAIASGRTTALNQLGLGISAVSEKVQALRDFGNVTVASLTPAQKEVVLMQLAMQKLPTVMAEAKGSAHSLASEQARLSAEWDVAKATLGEALLPQVTKGVTALANWLQKMERSGRLQRDFNQGAKLAASVIGAVKSVLGSAVHIWEAFANAVGGSKHALIGLAGAFALLKVGGIGKAATKDVDSIGNRVKSRFKEIQTQARQSSNKVAADFSGASKKIVAQTDAMQKAGNKWGTEMASNASKVKEKVGSTSTSFGALDTAFKKSGSTATKQFGAMNDAFNSFSNNTKKQSSGFSNAIRTSSVRAGSAFKTAATGMKVAAIEVGATIKSAIISTGIGLLVVAIGIAVGYIITHFGTVKKYVIAVAEAIAGAWEGLKRTLIGIGEVIAGSLTTSLTLPLRGFLEASAKVTGWLSFIPGFSGFHSKIESGLNSLKSVTTGLLFKGTHNIVGGINDIMSGASKAWTKALQDAGGDPKSANAARKSGQKLGKSMADGASSAITQVVPALTKTISDALQNAVAAAHKAILDSVRQAKDNLDKIGSDLANTLAQIQQKLGSATGAIAGSPQGKAFAKLKKLIESGAPSFEIQKAQAELAGQLQNAGKTQKKTNVVATQIANLTAAFNKGQIGYTTFEARLHRILREDGITMAEALKKAGPALADQLRAEIRALAAQARAIAATPARFRSVGGAGGAADIKIIQPLQVIKQEQMKVRTAVEKAAAEARKQRAAILKQEQKNGVLADQARAAGVRVHFVGPGPHGTASATGTRHPHTATLDQIRAHTRRAADHLTRHKRTTNHVTSGQVAALQARINRLSAAFDNAQQHSSVRVVLLQRQLQTAQQQLRVLKAEQAAQSRARATASRKESSPSGKFAEIAKLAGSFGQMARQIGLLHTSNVAIKSAINAETTTLLRGLREVCADIAAADKDIVAAELGLHSPLENLRRTELRIGDHAAKQRAHQIRLQSETNSLLRRIDRHPKGPVPGFNKERPGTGSHHARNAANAGVRA